MQRSGTWIEPGAPAGPAGPGRRFTAFDVLFPLLYALGYALVAVAMHLRGDRFGDLDLDTDFYGDLLLAAKKLVRGEFSVLDYPYKGPLYPIVLAGVHAIASDWYRAAVLVSAASAAGTLVVTYHVAAHVFGRAVAVPTIVLTSLVPEFFLNAHHSATDLLFLFLATSSILVFLTGFRRATDRLAVASFAAAGALAAAACLTRYNGAFLPMAGLLVLGAVNPGRAPWRRRGRHALAYVATFLLFCAPWVALNLRETGKPLATRNIQNVATGLFPGPRWAGTPISDTQDLAGLIERNPLQTAAQLGRNWVDHLRQDLTKLLGWPGAVLALLGLADVLVAPPSRALWAYLCFPATYFVLMGAVFYAPRFFLLLIPAYYSLGLAFLLGARAGAAPPWIARLWRRAQPAPVQPGPSAAPARPSTSAASPARRGTSAVPARRGTSAAPARPGTSAAPAPLGRRLLPRRWALGLLAAAGAGLATVQVVRIHAVESRIFARRPLYLLEAANRLRAHAAASGDSVVMAFKGHIAHLAGLTYQPYPRAAARSLDKLLQFASERGVDYVVYGIPEMVMCPELRFLMAVDSMPGLQSVYTTPLIRIFARTGAPPAELAAKRHELLLASLHDAMRRGAMDLVVQAHGSLAEYYLEHGDPARAETELRAAIDVAEGAADAPPHMRRNAAVGRYKLARLRLAAGRPQEALLLAQEILTYCEREGAPQDEAQARYLLADCYDALGRSDDADAQYRQARPLAPDTR